MEYITKSMKKKEIAVILSFYDGMRFISEQINSILSQNIPDDINLSLYIRNDQENPDETVLHFLNTVQEIPNVEVIPTSGKNVGVQNSFLELLQYAEADYYFFSDQDDVWMNDKIEQIMNVFKKNEQQNNEKSMLVYSDVQLVDENGNDIGMEFEDYVSNRCDNSFEHRIFYDNVTGAAMAINRKLRDLTIRIKPELFKSVHMHDSAIAQLGSLSGTIVYLPKKLIKYRQHDRNTIGMGQNRPFKYSLTNLREKIQYYSNHLNQAKLMIKNLDESELIFNNSNLLDLIVTSDNQSFFSRLKNGYQLSKYVKGFLNKTIVVILKC